MCCYVVHFRGFAAQRSKQKRKKLELDVLRHILSVVRRAVLLVDIVTVAFFFHI